MQTTDEITNERAGQKKHKNNVWKLAHASLTQTVWIDFGEADVFTLAMGYSIAKSYHNEFPGWPSSVTSALQKRPLMGEGFIVFDAEAFVEMTMLSALSRPLLFPGAAVKLGSRLETLCTEASRLIGRKRSVLGVFAKAAKDKDQRQRLRSMNGTLVGRVGGPDQRDYTKTEDKDVQAFCEEGFQRLPTLFADKETKKRRKHNLIESGEPQIDEDIPFLSNVDQEEDNLNDDVDDVDDLLDEDEENESKPSVGVGVGGGVEQSVDGGVGEFTDAEKRLLLRPTELPLRPPAPRAEDDYDADTAAAAAAENGDDDVDGDVDGDDLDGEAVVKIGGLWEGVCHLLAKPVTMIFTSEYLGLSLAPAYEVDETKGVGAEVMQVTGKARDLAVRVGWRIAAINGKDTRELDFNKVLKILDHEHERTKGALSVTFDTRILASELYAIEIPLEDINKLFVMGKEEKGQKLAEKNVLYILDKKMAEMGGSLVWKEPSMKAFLGDPGSMTSMHIDNVPKLETCFQLHGTKVVCMTTWENTQRFIDEFSNVSVSATKPTGIALDVLKESLLTVCALNPGDIMVFSSACPHLATNGVKDMNASVFGGFMTCASFPRLCVDPWKGMHEGEEQIKAADIITNSEGDVKQLQDIMTALKQRSTPSAHDSPSRFALMKHYLGTIKMMTESRQMALNSLFQRANPRSYDQTPMAPVSKDLPPLSPVDVWEGEKVRLSDLFLAIPPSTSHTRKAAVDAYFSR